MDLWIIMSRDRGLIMREKEVFTRDEHQGTRVYAYASREAAQAMIDRRCYFYSKKAHAYIQERILAPGNLLQLEPVMFYSEV